MNRKVGVAAAVIAVVAAVLFAWRWRHQTSVPAAASPIAREPSGAGAHRDRAPRRVAIDQPLLVIDAEPAGALRVEGQVVDAESQGVGGATVVISARPPRTVVTEADGSFAFDHLIGRQYT